MIHWIKSLFPNLRAAMIQWSEDDASTMAASVAYYLALSLFPLVLLLISGLGLFLEFTNLGKNAEQQFLETVAVNGSPVIVDQFRDILKQLRQQSLISCPSGLVAAILAAIGVFAQLDRGLDRIWKITSKKETSVHGTVKKVLRDRFWAFTMLVSLAAMVAILFVANMATSHIRSLAGQTVPSLTHVLGVFDLTCTTLANACLFGMAYRYLPKKKVRWRYALRGGLLSAIIWELGRVVLGMFLIGMRYTSAYGAIGSFIALLLWCYYGVSIFFFGAEYVQVLQEKGREARETATQNLDEIGVDQRIVELSMPESSMFEQPILVERQRPRRAVVTSHP